MCGLVGMAGNGLFKSDIGMFKDLLYISGLRGEDSTGVVLAATNKKNNNVAVLKEKETPSQFIRGYEAYGMFDGGNGVNVMMGHTRYGTVGKNSKENAHPFEFSQIIGMHNGTLRDKKYLGGTTTDSEAMFRDMNSRGIKPVLEELQHDSAFAISVYDKKTRKFYLARNIHRTLYVGVNTQFGLVTWASECDMIHLAAKRNHLKMECYYLQPGVLYEFEVNDIKKRGDKPWVDVDIKLQEAPPKVIKSTVVQGTWTKSRSSIEGYEGFQSGASELWDDIEIERKYGQLIL